ncbi:MAG: C39 family peptidase [Anaerolineae bacterium]
MTVENDGRPVGLVQIWAKKSMGVPFHTVSTSTVLLDLNRRAAEAHEIATQTLGKVEIVETEMVYYEFPKRAFALTFRREGVTDQLLVDVTTRRIVPPDEVLPLVTMLNPDNLRESMRTWETLREHLDDRVQKQGLGVLGTNKKVLNVPLYGQDNACHCVPATAQMIYKYRTGYKRSQDSLAAVFGTTMDPCGTPLSNIAPGWNLLGFWASLTQHKAYFGTVRNEINDNYPFHSIAGAHSRALIGYWTFSHEQYARINDPWPIGQGYAYWENRASSPETDYVRVH